MRNISNIVLALCHENAVMPCPKDGWVLYALTMSRQLHHELKKGKSVQGAHHTYNLASSDGGNRTQYYQASPRQEPTTPQAKAQPPPHSSRPQHRRRQPAALLGEAAG